MKIYDMGVIAKDKNQLKLYYNSNTALGKQTRSYSNGAREKLLTIDTANENVTGTQWSELAEGLDIRIEELIDHENADFLEKYDRNLDLEESDWLRILEAHPEFVRKPILIVGDRFHFVETPSDVVQFTASKNNDSRQ